MASRPVSADLGALFDEHVAAEFDAKDADATMETMSEDPTVVHVPVLTGGSGDRGTPRRLPITGSVQAQSLVDPSVALNQLIISTR